MKDARFGASALLRVAGLPIRYWLSAANPSLTQMVRQYEVLCERRATTVARVADAIGNELVPNPAFDRAGRASLLEARRTLHRGGVLDQMQCSALAAAVARASRLDSGLDDDLTTMAELDRSLAGRANAIEHAIEAEQQRLLVLPDQLATESAVVRAILPAPPEGQKAPGRAPTRRDRRRRLEPSWRRITRAATSCTPRDWFSHVALLDSGHTARERVPAVGPAFDVKRTESVRAGRRRYADPPEFWPLPDSLVAMNPLHWTEDDRLETLVLDHHAEPTRVAVRRTDLLQAVSGALAAGSRSFAEVAATLNLTSSEERLGLQGFIRHLASLGIVQTAEAPRAELHRDATPGSSCLGRVDEGAEPAGWTDVYRTAESALHSNAVEGLQQPVGQALRLLALLREPQGGKASVALDAPTAARGCWTFGEIIRSEIDAAEALPSNDVARHAASARSAIEAGPIGFARLLDGHLDATPAGAPVGTLNLNAGALDDLGAPGATIEWPFDCLLHIPRPGAGYQAVLDQVRPPGVLDARFIETLIELRGSAQHFEAYRAFLSEVEALTGVLLVELLAPPLTDGAANAVRRPVYVHAWTGDPLSATYFPSGGQPERFIPLDAIRLRRIDGELRADVDGRLIWPVHHATRSFSSPWDRLARILLASAPDVLPWGFSNFQDSWDLLPPRPALPRIVVEGIVVFPARWRIPRQDLWQEDASIREKLQSLVRLRDRLGLPRWLYVRGASVDPPVACDLDSILAFRTIERALRGASEVCLSEMLPRADELLVEDQAHGPGDLVVSAFQVRFPVDSSPHELAARVAPRILASLGRSQPFSQEAHAAAMCRDPPEESAFTQRRGQSPIEV